MLKSTDHSLDDSVRSTDRNGNSCSLSDPNPDPRPVVRVARRLGRLVSIPEHDEGITEEYHGAPDPKPMKHPKGHALKSGVMINPKSDRGGVQISYPSGQIPAHPTNNNNHRHTAQ